MPKRTRVVFLGANPYDQDNPLDLKREMSSIEESIRSSKFADQIDLETCLDAEPLDLLSNLIKKEPAILHFAGHGDKSGYLAFQNKAGLTQYASPASVTRVFKALPRAVRLVFLNACYSEKQAMAIREIIDFTVGMNDEIGDEAAIQFAKMFYLSIAEGNSVSAAYHAGVAALHLVGIPAENTPVLLPGDHADPDRPFLISDDADYLTRRSIQLNPPPGMTPADGYSYGLKWVREGHDPDNAPLRNRVYGFVDYGGTLRCDVEFRAALGLQFKCFVECPAALESLAELPRNWVQAEQVGRTVWFLLDDEKYQTYETPYTHYLNNYIPSDGGVLPRTQGGPSRTLSQVRIHESTPKVPAAPDSQTTAGNASMTTRRAGPLLTIDLDEFISTLQPGDVLLLDSLHPLSRLIQFAENRPVSHAAIYLGGSDRLAEFAHTTKHTQVEPAARKARLRARLRVNPGPYDRTVTALRHVDVLSGSADTQGIIDRVDHYVDAANTRYAYLNLIVLMAPSLLRSYNQYLSGGRVPSRTLGHFLEKASNTLLGLFDVAHRDREFRLQEAKCTLTCSEFVYRCYAESGSGLEIDVADPLERWKSKPRAAEAPAAALGHMDGLGLVELHSGITSMLEQGAVRSGHGGHEAEQRATRRELASRTVGALGELMTHNLKMSKYDKVETVRGNARTRACAQIVGGRVIPDLVTPRDLWSSPSLKVCSILHRPPDSDVDTKLDDLH
jgi:hypothetical protein